MMRAWNLMLGVGLIGLAMACGGASSQPLTPDPDPTPTDQDIAALQNAQTSVAAGEDAGTKDDPAAAGAATSKKSPAPKKP